jgi:predicted ester cyclase
MHKEDPQKLSLWKMVEGGFLESDTNIAFEICHPKYRNDTSVRAVPDGPEGLDAHIRNARSAGNKGARLHLIDILAEGDRAALIWQTQGVGGRYLVEASPTRETSAWLIAHIGFVDGLMHRHIINWEPLRLMVQGGVRFESGGPNFETLGLEALRCEAISQYPDKEQLCEPRIAPEDGLAAIAEQALIYSWGGDAAAPSIASDAYLSFADLPDQQGGEGLAVRRAKQQAAFSDVIFNIDSSVSDDDRAILRWTLDCRNSGEWLGIEATGRPLKATGSVYARFENGELKTWIELVDLLRLLRQNGSMATIMPGCYPDQ